MPPASEDATNKKAVAIAVLNSDPEPNPKKKADELKGGGGGGEEDELSEEDKALKEGLDLAVERISDVKHGIQKNALAYVTQEIRSATTSMTSVPKPLKFLQRHYATLVSLHKAMEEGGTLSNAENIRALADILSILAMTMAPAESRDCLNYKLKGNTHELDAWGHEYLRSLAGDIGREYSERMMAKAADLKNMEDDEGDAVMGETDVSDLIAIVDGIAPYNLQHNAEAEAVDLLVEVQRVHVLAESPHIDSTNYRRVCLYLLRMADYMPDQDDLAMLLETTYQLYCKQEGARCDALRVALRMGCKDKIASLFKAAAGTPTELKQMAFILARHQSPFMVSDDDLNDLIGNVKLSDYFHTLAKDLDVLASKTPEDIYKSHLAEGAGFSRRSYTGGVQIDSARANLASTFVNGFVNAGHGTDSLMTVEESAWLYKNKELGMLSAAASLGLILLWNVEQGLVQIDKLFYCTEEYIKAGAALAVGIVSSGVRSDPDPARALLSQYVEGPQGIMRIASSVGLGIAYAGKERKDVMELLIPIVADSETFDIAEVGLTALSLGLIFAGTCDDDVGSVLVQRLMEASAVELGHPMTKYLCLGIGLLFLGRQECVDAMVEVVRTVDHRISKFAEVVLESCAYACTGNVLEVQKMLHMCVEHLESGAEYQQAAVLGIALVASGEDVGSEMSLRAFDHLLHYGELPIRRVVPLAMAMLNVSNPEVSVIDQLSRLSHDNDQDVAQSAILGLGFIAAGTNNSRVAKLLRQLSEFYSREHGPLFCTRVAQGLNHMGKGLLTINPFHGDRLVCSPAAMGGLLAVLYTCMDAHNTILDKYHYMLYYLAPAMMPRMLMTVDENFEPLAASVRVGQAVETVGQAGKPKTITGFQTHKTPVLLGVKDRAELATDEYIAVSNVLEGVVILKSNPEFEAGSEKK